MPKKGNDKKGNKGKAGNIAKVEPYAVEVQEALTALQLLDAAEPQIVFLSICTLDTYVAKLGKPGLVYLQERDLLGKLFKNLQNVKATRTVCLKILVQLIQIENILPTIQENPEYVNILITIFMSSDDLIEIEYTTYLLSYICEVVCCGELLCREDIIGKLFKITVYAMDLDVKYNCLKLILRMVSCRMKREIIAESKSFSVKTLNLILQGPFSCLRPVTVEIFELISAWEMPTIQDVLFKMETMTYLCDILAEDNWTTVQNKALTSIYNCMKFHPVQVTCIESKKFLKFVNFARSNGPDHALACISLIGALVTENENRQALLDLRVHEVLADYCIYDCDLVYVKFCDTLSECCKNCHIITEMSNKNVLKEIERLMRKKELPWIPYREAGIQPLYLFLMHNPRIGILLYQSNILKYILEAILHKDDLEKCYYGMALQMFQSMLGSRCLHRYLWSQELYNQFISLFNDCDADYVKLAIDVIKRTFYSQEYRQWFLDLHGVDLLAKMLCKRDCDYIEEAIIFCKFATRYNDIGICLLRCGIIPVLQDIGISIAHQKPICDSIVDDIYKCEYSIKFHITWFLDYQEAIKNGFCVYIGPKPRKFPADEVNDIKKLCYTTTMITVNFHGKKRVLLPAAIGNREPKCPSNSLDYAASEPNEEPEEQCIYKLELPVPDNNPDTDYYLKKYLTQAQVLLEPDDTFVNKIAILAKFVASRLCGHDGGLPTKHQYETHISELKNKLRSNYIPLGHIRIGGMMERALLFKVLGDRVGIPCTLRRTGNFCAWNEVPVYSNTPSCISSNLRYNYVESCVVDLMEDIGALLLVGHRSTEYYCRKSEKYAHSFEVDFSDSSTDLTEEEVEEKISSIL